MWERERDFLFLFLFSFSSLMKMSQRWNTFSSVVAQHCSPLIIIIKTRLRYTVYTINTKSVLSQVQKYLISRLCFKIEKKKNDRAYVKTSLETEIETGITRRIT